MVMCTVHVLGTKKTERMQKMMIVDC